MTQMYSYTTMTLRDIIKSNPDLLDNLILSTTDRTNNFKDMFIAMYNNKSIGAETVTLFQYWIEDKFNEIKRYYEGKLDVYEKELDGDLGIAINRVKQEANHSRIDNSSDLSHQENSTENTTNYDLPRTTNATASPTTKIEVIGNTNGTNYNTSASEGNGTNAVNESITGDVNVIEQRDKWLSFIRDIYRDMCKEFKDCFALIYA